MAELKRLLLALALLVPLSARAEPDYSRLVVETQITAQPDPALTYSHAFVMLGVLQVFDRTGDPDYLAYVERWADRWVAARPKLNVLDNWLAGRVMLRLHGSKYRSEADRIYQASLAHTTTQNGALTHKASLPQVWLDGAYMALPFLAEYGDYSRAIRNLVWYGRLLDGPWRHAYDESRSAAWADLATGKSPEMWCRAMGWYGVAITQIIDLKADDNPGLEAIREDWLAEVLATQDPTTGLWNQVMTATNWLETSCSAMHAYVLKRMGFQAQADAARAGVLSRLTVDDNGRTSLRDTSQGTSVGDYAYYVSRLRVTNEPKGVGAFLLMNEEWR